MKIDLANSPSNLIKLKNIQSIQYLEFSTKDPNSSHQSAYLTPSQMNIQLIELKKRLNKLNSIIYDYELMTYNIDQKLMGELKFYFFIINGSENVDKFRNLVKFKDFKLFELRHITLTKKNLKNQNFCEFNKNNFEGLEGLLTFPNNFNQQNKDLIPILQAFLKAFRKTLNRSLCEAGGVLFGDEIVQICWNPAYNPNSTWYFKGLPHNPDWPTLEETSLQYHLWFNHGTLYCSVNAKKHNTRLIEWDDVKNIASESPALQSDPLNPVINLEFPVQALSSPHLAPVEILGFPFGLTEEVETLILKRWCTVLSLPTFKGPNNCQQPFKKSSPRIPNLTYVKFSKSENQSIILFPTFAIFIPLPEEYFDSVQFTSKTTWNLAWDYTEIYFNMMEYILLNTNLTPQHQQQSNNNNNNLRPLPRDTSQSSINSPQALIPHPPTPSAIDYGRLGRELDTWDYLSTQFTTSDPTQTQNQPLHFTPTHIQSLPPPSQSTQNPTDDFSTNFFDDLDLNNFNLNNMDPLHQNLNLGGFDSLDVTDDDFSFFDAKKDNSNQQAQQMSMITGGQVQQSPKLIGLFDEPSNANGSESKDSGLIGNNGNSSGGNVTGLAAKSAVNIGSKSDEPIKEEQTKATVKASAQASTLKEIKIASTQISSLAGNKRYPTYLASDYAPIKQFATYKPALKLDRFERLKPKNKLRSDYSPVYNPYNYLKLRKNLSKPTETKLDLPIKQKKVGKVPEMVKNLIIKTEGGGGEDSLNQGNLQSSSQILLKSNLNDPESEKEEGESLNTNDTNISAKSSIEKLLPNLELIQKPINTSFPWVHYGNGLFEDDLSLQVFIDQILFIPNYTKSPAIGTEVMGQDNYSKILGFAKVLRKVCNGIELEGKTEENSNNNEGGEAKEEDKKLLISSFLPLKQYSNLKEKTYKEDNPILIQYKEPHLRLGYKANWISVKPSSIQFWDRLDLVPMNNSKQIQYCCLIPQNRDLLLECNNFFNNLKYSFQQGSFGTLESLKNVNCLKDGYLQISRPIAGNGMSQGYNQGGQAQPGGQGQTVDMAGGRVNQHQEGITTPQTPGLNQSATPTQSSQPFDNISKEAILDTYFRHASMLSDELFALNQRDPNQLQQQTPQTIIVFYITYQIPLTYQMLFELSSTLTKSIFKKNNSEANNFKIQLVPLPLEFLLSFRNLEESSKILLNFSLNLYNQVYNLTRSEDDQILKSFQPSYSLVPNLPKKIKFGPDTGEEEFREDKFYCHLSYSLGPNYEYVMVHWSDNVGVNRDFSVIPLPVFNPNKPIPYPLYLHHLWNATQAFVQRSCPWSPDSPNIVYFITKLGKLYKLELEAWRLFWDSTNSLICLFSLLGESQFNCFPNLKDLDYLNVGGIKMSKSGKSMSGSGLNANTSNTNIDDFGGELEEEYGFTGNRNRHLILLPASRYPISPDVIPLLMGVILDLPVVPIGQNQKVRLNTNLTQNFTSPNYCAISDTHLPNSISNQQKTIQLALIYHTKTDLQTHEIFKTFLKQTSDLSYLNLDYYLQDPNFQVSKELLKFGEHSNRLGVILDLVGFGCCKLPYNWYLMVRTTVALIEGGVAMGDRYLN